MHNPNFASGPCSKRPAWSLDALKDAAVGRSHRSALGKEKLNLAVSETKRILGIPEDYLVGVMPASDTGAFEAAMWSLLGARPVTVLVWESFSEGWATDVAKQLKLNPTILRADYGQIPDLKAVNWEHDCRLRRQRNDQRREDPQLGLDPGRPEGPLPLRCHERRLRHADRLVEDRCGDLLLAEVSRR